jgi:ribosome-associated protein
MKRKASGKGAGSGKARNQNLDDIVNSIALITLDKKAEEVIILDLREVSDATDYFIMVSGDTDIQVRAIADHVVEKIKETEGIAPWHIEGYRYGTWILLDFVDFVLHVFERSTRQYYQLERLWGDAKMVEIENLTESENGPGKPDSPSGV